MAAMSALFVMTLSRKQPVVQPQMTDQTPAFS
jgi:hypothetical protein